MFKNLRLISLLTLIYLNFTNQLYSSDIPVILIAPSKTPQSNSTVGSSVIVLDENLDYNYLYIVTLASVTDCNTYSISF